MKPSLLAAIVAFASLVGIQVQSAPAPVYENRGFVSNPSVDATVFLNRGTFSIGSGSVPYDTQNTRHYTNFPGASIEGTGGFQFDFVNDAGVRRRADNFVNHGLINLGGFDFGGFNFGDLDLPLSTVGFLQNSWLLVNASNIVSRGGLTVGSGGLLRLDGNNVNLARGGVRAGVDPFATIRVGTTFGINYRNDAGVTDLHWGAGQNNVLDPAGPDPFDLSLLTGRIPSSGRHEVLDRTSLTNLVTLSATNVFAITNRVNATNWIVQAVFVNTNAADPDLKISVRWSSAPRINNIAGAQMPIIQFALQDVDTITTEPFTNFVYLLDSLGAMTNAVLGTNLATRADQKPTSFIVTRTTPPEWARARTNTVPWTPDLLYNANYLSQTVTNTYAGYQAMIGTIASGGTEVTIGGGSIGGGSTGGSFSGGGFLSSIPELTHPTNLPGRIEISADRLDLTLSRFRSDGLLSIKAKELVGQAPYKLDSAYVSADLGSSSSELLVENIVQPVVRRFNGIITAWSAAWTNQTQFTAPSAADPAIQETNTVDVRFHALIVEHDFITRQTVETYKFAARAKQFTLRDNLTVRESFTVDAPDVELASVVDLGSIPITPAMFPSVVNLTNGIYAGSDAVSELGSTNRSIPNFVNFGFLTAPALQLNAREFSNEGEVSAYSSDLVANVRNAKIEGGSLRAASNLRITADDLKVTGSLLNAGYEQRSFTTGNTNFFLGHLSLDVRTRLTDGGVTASNLWTVYDGATLVRQPIESDLLGTRLVSKAGRFADIGIAWAGADRGATASGFENNAALGSLVLHGRLFSIHTFRSSVSRPAALYVDQLIFEDEALRDPAGYLFVEPGFTLYFADSNVDPASLDGLFEGRLRWVKTVAGANSGVNVTLSDGQVLRVNRGLLKSLSDDSDLDGKANAVDSTPFESDALKVRVNLLAGTLDQVELSWGGTPGGRYRVEYSSRLQGGEWSVLATCEHASSSPGVVKVCDTLSASGEQKYYRVVEIR